MIRLQQGFGVGTGNVAVEIIELTEEVGIVNHDIILKIAIIIVLTCVTANDLVRLEAEMPGRTTGVECRCTWPSFVFSCCFDAFSLPYRASSAKTASKKCGMQIRIFTGSLFLFVLF